MKDATVVAFTSGKKRGSKEFRKSANRSHVSPVIFFIEHPLGSSRYTLSEKLHKIVLSKKSFSSLSICPILWIK